jgi:hypothetical protein
MKTKLNLITGQWSFDHSVSDIRIGFISSRKTVKFDNLSWGWKIGDQEKEYSGVLESDQDYLSADNINAEGEVTLEVWAENAGIRYEDEITYTYKDVHQLIIEEWRQTASLSRRRFKIGEALYEVNGTPLVELIEALLAGLPEPHKTVASIAYAESGQFDRLDPFVLQFSQALGMSDEDTDAFFQYCLDETWQQ